MVDIISEVFLWFFYSSLIASGLALLILLVEKLFKQGLGIRLRHALWLLVLIRLLIPFIPDNPVNVLRLLPENAQNIIKLKNKPVSPEVYIPVQEQDYLYKLATKKAFESMDNTATMLKPVVSEQTSQAEGIKWNTLKTASILWLTGSLIVTLLYLIIALRVHKRIINSRKPAGPEVVSLLDECRSKLNIRRKISAYTQKRFKSPCISGIFKTAIYLPEGILDQINSQQLANVLTHELAHYKRKDIVFNLLGTIVLLLHWFNPLVWLSIKRMKFVGELACDAYVLESIGEDKSINYGETLINLSRLYLNNSRKLTLASFFETRNQIEKRIDMINRFKRGSYKITAAAIVCLIVLSTFTLTIALSSESTDQEAAKVVENKNITAVENKTEQKIEQPRKKESKFLIDEPVKAYGDIKKVERVAGFSFKVPSYVPEGYSANGYHLLKASDDNNVLKIFFSKKNSGNIISGFEYLTSEISLLEYLPDSTKKQFTIAGIHKNESIKVESSSEALNIGGISGTAMTIKIVFKEEKPFELIRKYFVWQDSGVWYAVNHNEFSQNSSGKAKNLKELSLKEVEKTAASIKPLKDADSAVYKATQPELSTEIGQLSIYDKEDLKKAVEILGFTPKFPLSILESYKASFAGVNIAPNSDIKNKNLIYELNMAFYFGEGIIALAQGKDPTVYNQAKQNGIIIIKDAVSNASQKIKAESIGGYTKEIFTYELKYSPDIEGERHYIWKEDGFYCRLVILDKNANVDEILKSVINEKTADF